jgi:SAM-dependent methyltransferase
MRIVDRFLQAWRARKAAPWVTDGARVLDVGCHQGEFLRGLAHRVGPSVGLDPLARPETGPGLCLLAEPFTEATPISDAGFDAIVLLATLEHIRDKDQLADLCWRRLAPGGRVIITVPAPFVDAIVAVLCRLKVADGMSLDEHHGFDPSTTPEIFGRHGFTLEHHSRFQLGLNHLFVCRKPADAVHPSEPIVEVEAVAHG